MLVLEITEKAEADIENIYLYIAMESYQSYAESFAGNLFKTFDLLCHSPALGVRREQSGEGVRLYPVDRINIIYRVTDTALQVLRVHHSTMDSSRLKL